MNSVILIGRLTADPDVRYTQGSNTCVARFTLAIDRPARQGEEKQADFPVVKAFGKTAELVQRYIHKGSKIAVEGRLQTGSYKNKNGDTVYTTEVIANRVEFLDTREQRQQPQTDCPSARPVLPDEMDVPSVFQYVDEDIPY